MKKMLNTNTDVTFKGGYSLLSRKNWAPTNCLSCGRGDVSLVPAAPHVLGNDNKFYRADM